MENIFSNSSVVDELAADQQKQDQTNQPLADFADQLAQEEFGKTQAAARWAKQYDPQAYAEATKLAPEVPPEVGVRQLQLLRDNANLAKYQDIFQRSPELRGYYFDNPDKLPYAHPDELDNVSGLPYVFKAGAASFQYGWDQTEAAMAANRIAAGQPAPGDQKLVDNFDMERTFGARGFWDQALVLAGQTVPQMGLTIFHSLEGAVQGAVGGGLTGGFLGSGAGPAGTAAGVLSGSAVGGTVGSVMGAYDYQQKLQTGISRLYFAKLKDENGKPLEPELQDFASRVTGITGAALELVSLNKVLETVPGGKQITSFLGREGMAEILKQPTVRAALLNFIRNTSEVGVTETATEVLQQGIQIASEEVAKQQSSGDFASKTPEEIAQELLDTATQAFKATAILGPLAAGTRFAGDLVNVYRSQRQQANLTKAGELLQNNEFVKRAPEEAAKVIDTIAPDQPVYIPVNEAEVLFQEQGKDLYSVPIPNWRDRIDEAKAVGGDAQITLGEYLAHFASDPKNNPLAAIVRTSPEGYTNQELISTKTALEDLVKSEVARAQDISSSIPEQRAAAQPVESFPEVDRLRKQLLQVGFNNEAAQAYTSLLGSFFQTMATRAGVSPSEFFNQFMLEIERGTSYNVEEGDQASQQFVSVERTGKKRAGPKLPSGLIALQEGKAKIQLFDNHDMSTLLHESGHFFLNTLHQVKDVNPGFQEDWAAISKYLGIKEGQAPNQAQHEKFARQAEAYFFEGKAPAPELQGAFTRFARWLKTIYRRYTAVGGRVSDPVRQVMERMLITEQRIKELQADYAYAPLFKTAEEYGLDPKDYAEYQNYVESLRQVEQAKAMNKIIGQQERLNSGWMGEVQKELAKEMEQELKSKPPYNHIQTIKEKGLKISTKDFEAKYGPEAKAKFPREAFSAREGLGAEVVAELLGYPNADEMVYDFVNAPTIKEAAKVLAEQEMVKRYGEDYNNSEIKDLAIKRAFAEDARLTVLSKELQVLNRRTNKKTGVKGAKDIAIKVARDTIYKKQIKDLNEYQANANVRRAAAEAEKAMVKGDWVTAADWKRKQIVAQAYANELAKVTRTLEKIRDKGAKYSRKGSPSIDPGAMAQINDIVTKYNFTKMSKKKLARIESLRDYLDKAQADGLVTQPIPDVLLRQTEKPHWQELTVEDLLDLGDTIDNLEHLGKVKNKIKVGQAQEALDEAVQRSVERIRQRPNRPVKMKTYSQEEKKLFDHVAEFHATLLKPEQIVEFLDMGDVKGPLSDYVFEPIAQAEHKQNDMLAEYNSKLIDIFQGIPQSKLDETFLIPSLKTKMSKQEIFAIALNTGNESNYRKLMEGEMWTEANISDVLTHMDKEDWDRVQKVWDLLDSLWTHISAMERRLKGVAPPEIEGREFTNEHGTYRGGYYPVVYDFTGQRGKNLIEDTTPADREFFQGLFNNDFVAPGTNQKHTVKRTKVAKPILLDMKVLPRHIHNVIHDLSYREAIRGAYKILWHPDVKKAITEVEGRQVYDQLTYWLRAVATEHADTKADVTDRFIQRVRTGTTIYSMGYRLTTALAQPIGFFATLTKVPAAQLTKGIYYMSRHPFRTLEQVKQLSGEMRHRFNTQERDINETVRKLSAKKSFSDYFKLYGFYFIGAMDMYVSTASWLGAHSDYLLKNPTDISGAVRHADRVVRLTQGTGSAKDMAKIMNSGETKKLFTMFYSFFSAQYNMQVDLTRKTGNDITSGNYGRILKERLPQWAFLVVFPAVFGALVAGQGPEKDENPLWWALRKSLLYPASSVPFVRDLASILDTGFSGQFTPAARFIDEGSKALGALINKNKDFEQKLEAAWKPAASATAIWFKAPAGYAIQELDALWKGLDRGDFQASDLIYGRRGRQ